MASVSLSTVSRALHNDERISEATRLRIQAIAEREHFVRQKALPRWLPANPSVSVRSSSTASTPGSPPHHLKVCIQPSQEADTISFPSSCTPRNRWTAISAASPRTRTPTTSSSPRFCSAPSNPPSWRMPTSPSSALTRRTPKAMTPRCSSITPHPCGTPPSTYAISGTRRSASSNSPNQGHSGDTALPNASPPSNWRWAPQATIRGTFSVSVARTTAPIPRASPLCAHRYCPPADYGL